MVKTIYSNLQSLISCYVPYYSFLHVEWINIQPTLENVFCAVPPFSSLFLPLYQSWALLFSLLPFFLSAALYFYLWTPDLPLSITAAGVKSAPTLLLAAVVLSWNGGQSVLGVGGGLIFSAVGDCCLVWPELFLHGKCLVCT